MHVRPEIESDLDQTRAVNVAAFPTEAEAGLVDRLRIEARPLISLVAAEEDRIVGHILFSPMSLAAAADGLVMGLAPMAVRPDRQRQGIGSALVRSGLEQCRKLDAVAVAVLGHAEYYPRFGFEPASRFKVRSEYEVPDEVFMLLELKPGSIFRDGCVARYHHAFNTL